jgi:uroporphyrinogen-III synthase
LRVLLTRSAEDCAAWAEELEARGIASISLPCIAAETIDSPELREALAASARAADWIVFTSRRGVEAYARLAAREGERITAAPSPQSRPGRIAAVGAGTAEAAERVLGRIDLVGEAGTAESLARTLVAVLRDRNRAGLANSDDANRRVDVRVLLALAENAPDTLERALGAAGIDCRRFDVYRTVSAAALTDKRPLASLGVDAVLLASPSAVRGFANQVEPDASARLVTIGPTTSAAVRKLGLDVAGEAREPTLAALIEALLAVLGSSMSGGSIPEGHRTTHRRPTQPRSDETENSHA